MGQLSQREAEKPIQSQDPMHCNARINSSKQLPTPLWPGCHVPTGSHTVTFGAPKLGWDGGVGKQLIDFVLGIHGASSCKVIAQFLIVGFSRCNLLSIMPLALLRALHPKRRAPSVVRAGELHHALKPQLLQAS